MEDTLLDEDSVSSEEHANYAEKELNPDEYVEEGEKKSARAAEDSDLREEMSDSAEKTSNFSAEESDTSEGHPNYAQYELNPDEYVEEDESESDEDEEEGVPLLENHCTVNKELYFEAVQAMSNRTKDLVIAIISAILVPICLMLDNKALALVALIVALVALFYRAVIGQRDFRRLKSKHPSGQWTKRVRVFSDYVVTDSEDDEDNVTVVPLEDLKKVRETDHLCILDFGKKAPATLMDKNGFQIGSLEELRILMKELNVAEANKRANRTDS